jgi:hypothetical protein
VIHSEEAGFERRESVISVGSPGLVDVVTEFNLFVSNKFFVERGRYRRLANQID